MYGVDLGDPEHLGADEDAEHDLDHDRRQHDPALAPRENRPERRREEDEHDRALLGARQLGGERADARATPLTEATLSARRRAPPARRCPGRRRRMRDRGRPGAPSARAIVASRRASSRFTAGPVLGKRQLRSSSSSIARSRRTHLDRRAPYSRISVTPSVRKSSQRLTRITSAAGTPLDAASSVARESIVPICTERLAEMIDAPAPRSSGR